MKQLSMSEGEAIEARDCKVTDMGKVDRLVRAIAAKLPFSSFVYLSICQFVGAMNDNIFKLLLIYCFIQIEGIEASNRILSLTGACYVLPFIFLSATAGTIADRYSKRKIIVITRFIEILVFMLGGVAFYLQSKALAITSLVLLGCHSTIFGPCKLGIIPELVPKDEISRANGITTSCTYVAIIVGTFLASFLADVTDRNFVFSVFVASLFSIVSFFASLFIKKTPPSGSTRKISPWFITELVKALRIIRREPSLLSAVIGSAFFLFIGSFIQLNMIPFAMKNLHLSDVQGGYLFLLTALGIGVGSLLAGKLSGRTVEFGLVPIGGIGISICCFLLDHYSDSLIHEIFLITIVGIFGGLYLVPLDSYIQVASPPTYRGQVIATTNIFGFCGVLFSAGALYLFSEVFQMSPDKGFAFVGIMTLGIVVAISISMSGYIVRFFSFIFSYLFFPGSLRGKDQIPVDAPAIYFVPHSFSPWVLVLIAAQRRRMRLITVNFPEKLSYFARIIRKMVPILDVTSLEEVMPHGEKEDLISHAADRGTSVVLICSNTTIKEHAPQFIQAWKTVPNFKPKSYFELHHPETLPNSQTLGSTRMLADLIPVG